MNHIPELISDEVHAVLVEHRLLDEVGVRNYLIKKEFLEYRSRGMRVDDCLDRLSIKYKYIQPETIRRIAYGIEGKKKSCLN